MPKLLEHSNGGTRFEITFAPKHDSRNREHECHDHAPCHRQEAYECHHGDDPNHAPAILPMFPFYFSNLFLEDVVLEGIVVDAIIVLAVFVLGHFIGLSLSARYFPQGLKTRMA